MSQQSLDDFAQVIRKLMPSVGEYDNLITKGVQLRDGGDLDGALQLFHRAAELQRTLPVTYVYIAQVHDLRSESDEAIHYCDKAIQLDPTNVWGISLPTEWGPVWAVAVAWQVRASALSDKGKYEEAIRDFNVAIALNPYYGQAWFNKGCAELKARKAVDAYLSVDAALRINPRYEKARTVMYELGHRLGHLADTTTGQDSPNIIEERAKRIAEELRRSGVAARLGIEEVLFDVRRRKLDEMYETETKRGGIVTQRLSPEQRLEMGVTLFQKMGRPYEDAIPVFEEVLEIARRSGRKDLEAAACFCLMYVHIMTLQHKQAIEYARRAFTIAMGGRVTITYQEFDNTFAPEALDFDCHDIITHLNAAGAECLRSGKPEPAEEYLKAALEMSHEMEKG
jgi:tetratricopeptide (TPR) repeat protein